MWVTKTDIILLQRDIREMEQRVTIKMGGMLVVAIKLHICLMGGWNPDPIDLFIIDGSLIK